MRVAFIHPNLGVGGAERLIVDAAFYIQETKQYSVSIFTNYYDKNHCFDETKKLHIVCIGKSLSSSIFGYFYIFLVHLNYDLIIVDQATTSLPLLRLAIWIRDKLSSVHLNNIRILFYCHFPDKLLARQFALERRNSRSFLRRLYRIPFDFFEEWSLGYADNILYNSLFTKSVVKTAYPSLDFNTTQKTNATSQVIYPGIPVRSLSKILGNNESKVLDFVSSHDTILSINRFEKKKNIAVLIEAIKHIPDFKGLLIIAGGYDINLEENKSTLKSLQRSCEQLDLSYETLFQSNLQKSLNNNLKVLFLPSISGPMKEALLKHSCMLVYTPINEHFGIVPIEGMAAGSCIVIAMNSGGPLETISHGKTGFLVNPSVDDLSTKIKEVLLMDPATRSKMLTDAKEHALKNFSIEKFVDSLLSC